MEKRKLILAGGAGFLGQALSRHFVRAGYDVVVLTRRAKADCDGVRYIEWDARTGGAWCHELEGAYAVVNLVGRSVDCRYTEQNKRIILESRIASTALLGQCMRDCAQPPQFWINAASATIYADTRGNAPANTEDAGVIGRGFSVEVCQAWEAEFNRWQLEQTQQFCLRVAITLGADGGALVPLRALTRLGLGGAQGDGQQFVSWLHVDDFVGIIERILNGGLSAGLYNCASPHPLLNRDFMRALRAAYRMPFGVRLPKGLLAFGAWMIRTETELVLKSRKVYPERLLQAGYVFQHERIDTALQRCKTD